MNEKKICACVGARTRDTQKSKEHYEENFIPAGWNLEYTCLDQPEAARALYTRFLTYTLPEESGSSLRAVGFQVDGVVHSPSGGWNAPSRPRSTRRYPSGDKVRWVLHTP